MTWVGLLLAGAVGAVARFVLDGLIRGRLRTQFPVGTVAINVFGSGLLGLIFGLVAARVLPSEAQLILGTGLLGGFTTFSTASFETVRLVQAGRVLPGVGSGLLTLLLGVGFAAIGYATGVAL